jgi:hypothetical protein
MRTFFDWLHENEIPQPGVSSGKPAIFKPDAKPIKKYLTVNEIVSQVQGVPYYKEVIQDFDNNDKSWDVANKVIEYAKFMFDNHNKLKLLPPVIVIDGKLQDGAHRISAINLLKERLDKANALWHNLKLEVLFGTKDDLIPGDYHLA